MSSSVPTPSSTLSPAERSVQTLPGVGSGAADTLARLGIQTLGDLLNHVPARWVDLRSLSPLGSFRPPDADRRVLGEDGRLRKQVFTSFGRITRVQTLGKPQSYRSRAGGVKRGFGGAKQRLVVEVVEDSGTVDLVYFGGGWRASQFQEGSHVLVSGTLGHFRGRFQFQSPDCEFLSGEEEASFFRGGLVPVYPLTRGLLQSNLRQWMRAALDRVIPTLAETLPQELRERHQLQAGGEALRQYHFPGSPEERDVARHRLAFEELFLDQLFVYAVRLRREEGQQGGVVPGDGPRQRRLRASLPFQLTGDQDAALAEILGDMSRPRPMNRLLQGDVGSGKTVVALLAAAAAADAGLQTAFMVPTEILAEQHYRTLTKLGGDFELAPRLLVGSQSAPARREVLRDLASGAPLVVGTQALFQEGVRFQDLGLVILDEQHRFGVLQRVALTEKGRAPHVLAMSATPIPRSLALVRYADLDLTIIRERPPGRGEVITRVTPGSKRDAVYGFLRERLSEGRQAYIIYPLVEESERSQMAAAATKAAELAERPEFEGFPVGLLHGQMPSGEKEAVMGRFLAGEIRVLVATTVVEVGIDVPNATFMVIEHPERYGLSQLHQLRGRVGRGEHRSYCVLVHEQAMAPEALSRLQEFAVTDDGFRLAELDLTLRGQGDVTGTRQSGRPVYRVADPFRDAQLTMVAREEAQSALRDGGLLGGGGPQWGALQKTLHRLLEVSGANLASG